MRSPQAVAAPVRRSARSSWIGRVSDAAVSTRVMPERYAGATARVDPVATRRNLAQRGVTLQVGALSGGALSVGPERLLQPLDLAGELPRASRSDVGLQHERDSGAELADRLGGALDDVEHLIPLALDRGEHGVGLIRQAGFAHDLDGRRDGI